MVNQEADFIVVLTNSLQTRYSYQLAEKEKRVKGSAVKKSKWTSPVPRIREIITGVGKDYNFLKLAHNDEGKMLVEAINGFPLPSRKNAKLVLFICLNDPYYLALDGDTVFYKILK
jgi:hypothetical protein